MFEVRLCGNATSQPNATVNEKSDSFANNSPKNELNLPNIYDSSNQIVLHFLYGLVYITVTLHSLNQKP